MDLTGQRFGRLLVEGYDEPIPAKNRKYLYKTYLCLCECGTRKIVREQHLKDGNTKSCGCIVKENAAKKNKSHGHCCHPLWETWKGMNARCNNPNSGSYPDYGERGITVCDRWLQKHDSIEDGFLNFLEDMEASFEKGLEIERVDNDESYCPLNCKWATQKEQISNRRNTRELTFNGETLCVAEWSERIGVNYNALLSRVDVLFWSVEKALTTPTRKMRIKCE